jgi:Xaa-Pro dipeptidase
MANHVYDSWCRARRDRLASWLGENGIAGAVFVDAEGQRDPAIRYFTGHPGDAVLIVTAAGFAALSPWDENMAALMADANLIIPFTAFERDRIRAVHEISRNIIVPQGSRIEIPPTTSYPEFLKYVDVIQEYSIICRESHGAHKAAQDMRAVKDEYELGCLRQACRITDNIIGMIEDGARSGKIQTEMDAAFLIDREARLAGAEGAGFDTLAAGPSRSFGIHCFPPSTASKFPDKGLSILDFGVRYEGYTSDVTLTITQGTLSAAQEKQLDLVQKAYDEALVLYKPGTPVRSAAQKVKSLFARAKREMPHSLGHGIGLEVHEFPTIRTTVPSETVFEPGMTVTLEPGLYHPELGGCRLENSIHITENGNEPLTKARIIRL